MLNIQKAATKRSRNNLYGVIYASNILRKYATHRSMDSTRLISLFLFKNILLYDGN